MDLNLKYSVPHVTSLNPNFIHPLFNESLSLLDNLSIQINEERKSSLSSNYKLCVAVSEKSEFSTIYSNEIPLCCIPNNSFPILENQVIRLFLPLSCRQNMYCTHLSGF